MAEFIFPALGGVRGPGFWMNPVNWIASRKKFRRDYTVEWRRRYENDTPAAPERSTDFRDLTGLERLSDGFSFVVLGDTGEGDRSQYGLLPLLRALGPDFVVINGDLAYPAGSEKDFLEGFFQPYQNLRVPVWAVPGNHEYYSPHNGREFYDLFCTTKHVKLWRDNGLRFVPQPGTYWELSSADCPLVVLAVDSGMTAGLDPKQALFGFIKSEGDATQLAWLERRLSVAQAMRKKAIVLFHIPSLVNLKRAKKPRLQQLHGVIARFADTVSAVITAHEHSFQYYDAPVFAEFLSGVRPTGAAAGPRYFVSGSGGAFLSPVDFEYKQEAGVFEAAHIFPSKDQWRAYALAPKKAANVVGLARSAAARAVNSLAGALFDSDLAQYQSLLHVELKPDTAGVLRATMTPYFQASLNQLYEDQPDAKVLVREGQPPPTPNAIRKLTLRDPNNPASTLTFPLAP